ncbi:MAG: hypothetical protein PHH11_18085 [Methylomonas sp.]|nr:hypothetical protein [Methylomonas sp.]
MPKVKKTLTPYISSVRNGRLVEIAKGSFLGIQSQDADLVD